MPVWARRSEGSLLDFLFAFAGKTLSEDEVLVCGFYRGDEKGSYEYFLRPGQ